MEQKSVEATNMVGDRWEHYGTFGNIDEKMGKTFLVENSLETTHTYLYDIVRC